MEDHDIVQETGIKTISKKKSWSLGPWEHQFMKGWASQEKEFEFWSVGEPLKVFSPLLDSLQFNNIYFYNSG